MNASWNRSILSRWARAAASLLAIAMALPANAIPAFARMYGTGCVTCHVVVPKLTPFGEAFRRNGYPANKKTLPNCVERRDRLGVGVRVDRHLPAAM
jgi:hypothetical protein